MTDGAITCPKDQIFSHTKPLFILSERSTPATPCAKKQEGKIYRSSMLLGRERSNFDLNGAKISNKEYATYFWQCRVQLFELLNDRLDNPPFEGFDKPKDPTKDPL